MSATIGDASTRVSRTTTRRRSPRRCTDLSCSATAEMSAVVATALISRSALGRDVPGVARVEQRLEISGALLLHRGGELGVHAFVVARAIDVAEDADRRGADRVLREPREREREVRLVGVRRVHEQRVLADLRDLDDLERAVRPADDALLVLGAEADRLAGLQVDPVRLVLAHLVEGAVVEDVAVLEDLDERRAAMGGSRA